ncbi:MAG: multiheme c-type cytochrome [Campylobacterales bacterium]|nr:multiheme c-type cytochrome [Campylobacterales bacterium]
MRKKIINTLIAASIAGLGLFGYFMYQKHGKIIPFVEQLSKNQVGDLADIQPKSQKDAIYVGSQKCKKCHDDQFDQWSHSYHTKMIQDVKKDPLSIVGDFATLPPEASFKKEDIVYTIGSKFKQRYMMTQEINGTQDFIVGNYQWNTQVKKWQPYSVTKDWYHDGFDENNSKVGTSKTCDGCHFTGVMSQDTRTEPSVSCEACHGPGSKHAEKPKENEVYKASNADPKRATEVCLQCHMRNRDKRLEATDMHSLFGDVRDYPMGYEPGKPLNVYKTKAPFDGNDTDEFYANGVGKKNRTQGNEFVKSMMYKHGITCINCHNPHQLDNTVEKPLGDASCMKCHSFGSPIGPHQSSIEAHTHHKTDSKGSSCIECHMPKIGKHLPSSPATVRTHIFGFITPAETKKYKVPNACTNCHQDKSLDWADKSLSKWGMSQWTK